MCAKNYFYIFVPSDLKLSPLDLKFAPLVTLVYVFTKLEVSTAFLFSRKSEAGTN